jgi:hypothetical protein
MKPEAKDFDVGMLIAAENLLTTTKACWREYAGDEAERLAGLLVHL